jgi:hypothetical protein
VRCNSWLHLAGFPWCPRLDRTRTARLDLTPFNTGLDLSRFYGGSRLHLARFGSRLYPRLD